MTTIVYKEEMITSTASPGAPNVQSSKTVTVQILSDDGRTTSGNRSSGVPSNTPRHTSHSSTRRGSPKPNKKIHNVREGSKLSKGSFTAGFGAHPFLITAYLPYDGGKRLKVSRLLKSRLDAGELCGLLCHFHVEVWVFSLF